jgi:ribosomal protein S18 acetylase RimI-like enzyme
MGITPQSVVNDADAASRQLTFIHDCYGDALVERYIAGREFNVGIIELPELQVLPLAEVDFASAPELPWPIVTYEAKWSSGSAQDRATPVRCPVNIDVDLKRTIEQSAVAAYQMAGCRDYGRIDLRIDNQGCVYVLEVNANPDIGPEAGLARMLRAAGIEYDRFVSQLVATVASRHRSKAPLNDFQPSGTNSKITIRQLVPKDCPDLLELTRETDAFRPEEIEVAAEVLRDALKSASADDYQVLVAEVDGSSAGWSCHGRVPMTDATFDLYWIVVAPRAQRLGVGRALIAEVQRRVQSEKGRWLLAETSSTKPYAAAREFYRRCDFRQLSEIDDFYRRGDGRVIFGLRLDRS